MAPCYAPVALHALLCKGDDNPSPPLRVRNRCAGIPIMGMIDAMTRHDTPLDMVIDLLIDYWLDQAVAAEEATKKPDDCQSSGQV